MECNKDEAVRAKSIAEAKLEQKDFTAAKKFTLKAQTLYPTLDGISQMLTTLDVYVSAEKKINGEVNWYGVLGLSPSADDETIKKQYRKLALMLHPDKNNSVGAEGAFKLISEAWSLLSDKAKRLAYNQIMGFNFKGFQQKAPTHTGGPGPSSTHTCGPGPSTHTGGLWARTGSSSVRAGSSSVYTGPSAHTGGPPGPSMESPFSKFAKRKPPAPKSQRKSAKSAAPSKPSPAPPSNQIPETFWTICGQCRIQYEYHKLYRNTTLLCPNCKTPFVALEIPRPVTKSRSHKSNPWPPQQQQNARDNVHTPSANNDRGKNVVPDAQKSGAGQSGPNISMYQQGPPPASASVDRAGPSLAAKVTNFKDKLKRAVNTESNASAGMDGFMKKRKLDDYNGMYGKNYKMPDGNVNFGTASTTLDSACELTLLVMRKIMMENARKEITRKLNEPSSEGPAYKRKENKTEKIDRNNGNKTEKRDKNNGNSQKSHKKANIDPSADNAGVQNPGTVTMNVPDPDFYNFDQDRIEKSFVDNDVWAAYDDDDGMPRFYALIHKVISKKPFKLKISWLNSKTTAEFGAALDWVGLGFYKTCGEFRVGKHEICKFVNAFSQRVKWSKGLRGAVMILPQKGDVWALYRNWSSGWDTRTPDDVIHKYDMVMVLDGYNEEKGVVSVAPLVKVVGYRTVFRPNTDVEAVMKIPKVEMFRFSHLVPHHALASEEASDAPKGCVELDPAATPLELLGMATGANEAPNVETSTIEEIAGGMKHKTCQGDGTEGIQAFIARQV